MTAPRVSVVIPTYNRRDMLPRALDSVIRQTFHDWEIVLVDDGSTDGTSELVGRYAQKLGPRLRYRYQSNTGCGGARNAGIDASRGALVAFLDADDEYLPRKLERQIALFELRPELGLVYSDYAYIDTRGVRHASAADTLSPIARRVPHDVVAPGLCVCTGDLFPWLIRRYFVATIVGMVRRDVLGDTIRFAADPSYAAEWLFYLRVARACRCGFVDEPLCLHHHVEGSATRTDSHRNTVRLRKLLLDIRTTFRDVDPRSRRTIRRHLARACRQLGYDAYRAGAYHEAVGRFAESWRYRPAAGTLADLADAAARWWTRKATTLWRPASR
ncbi:MAG: glycosyltransferase family 2 protein [Phycisphaerae bacterium]